MPPVHVSTTLEQTEDGQPVRTLHVSGDVEFDSEGCGTVSALRVVNAYGLGVALSDSWEEGCREQLVEVAAELLEWWGERGAA